jgi:hypothetical protein
MNRKEELRCAIRNLLRERKRAEQTEFERKRREFSERVGRGYSPSAGELANILDGLTADGFDRLGRKVSFVERDKPVFG